MFPDTMDILFRRPPLVSKWEAVQMDGGANRGRPVVQRLPFITQMLMLLATTYERNINRRRKKKKAKQIPDVPMKS